MYEKNIRKLEKGETRRKLESASKEKNTIKKKRYLQIKLIVHGQI